jgi:hypothetical protein
VAVIVAGLQQLGVPFWAENIVYGVALAGGVGLSRRLTRMREEAARRDQLRALKESREEAARAGDAYPAITLVATTPQSAQRSPRRASG